MHEMLFAKIVCNSLLRLAFHEKPCYVASQFFKNISHTQVESELIFVKFTLQQLMCHIDIGMKQIRTALLTQEGPPRYELTGLLARHSLYTNPNIYQISHYEITDKHILIQQCYCFIAANTNGRIQQCCCLYWRKYPWNEYNSVIAFIEANIPGTNTTVLLSFLRQIPLEQIQQWYCLIEACTWTNFKW